MKSITAIIASVFISSAALAQDSQSILNAYLKVKDDLVQSDNKQASAHIGALQQAVGSTPAFDGKDQLVQAVQKMAKAGSIDQQRTAFADVSTVLWKTVKTAKGVEQPVYYQYCPMKKSYWLSTDAAVKNPYYGSQMLTCGKTVETRK